VASVTYTRQQCTPIAGSNLAQILWCFASSPEYPLVPLCVVVFVYYLDRLLHMRGMMYEREEQPIIVELLKLYHL
jgi:hypothetical protein